MIECTHSKIIQVGITIPGVYQFLLGLEQVLILDFQLYLVDLQFMGQVLNFLTFWRSSSLSAFWREKLL